jgi:gliding motility-associated-like protein
MMIVRRTGFQVYIAMIGLMLTAFHSSGQALNPPQITCIQTDNFGNVNINWQIPSDPLGEFVAYNIYWFNTNLGNPTASWLATVNNYNTSNFGHLGADGLNTPNCYFIQTQSTDGSSNFMSLSSDTVCATFLNVSQSVPQGIALLDWVGPYPYSPAPAGVQYELWKQPDLEPWSIEATLPITTYEYDDLIEQCEETNSYQIHVTTPWGCEMLSNPVTDDFVDETPPQIPSITSLSVETATGNVDVNWLPSPNTDTWGYIIYKCNFSQGIPIDTVYSATEVNYEHVTSQALTNSQCYKVAAFDSCLVNGDFQNLSATNPDCHCTILLNPPQWYNCNDFVTLNWSHYVGWDAGVDHYEIIYTEDGGAEQIAGTVAGNVTTFVHNGLSFGVSYRYIIKAYASGFSYTSRSNQSVPITLQQDTAPDVNYLMSASVENPDEISVLFNTEGVTLEHLYVLMGKEKGDPDYEEIASQWSANTDFLGFTDFDVSTSDFSYSYYVVVVNDCGDTVATSNIGCTMLLNGIANNNTLRNTLIWNPYEDFDGNVMSYRIYRSQEKGVLGNLVATFPGSVTFYEDDVSAFQESDGLFCYTIEAVENTNQYGYSSSSFSNAICLQMEPKIWVPNAFMVNGVNSTFFPVISFADFDNYEMHIFSRWGDIIFQSYDINEGWAGKKDGQTIPDGIYAYYIGVRDGNGQLHERRGTVCLLTAGTD